MSGAKFCPACGKAVPPEPARAPLAGPPAVDNPAAGLPGYLPVSDHLQAATPPATGRPKSTNGLAISSMVLGIVWVYWLGSILALIFGYVALGQIRDSGGRQGGRGMAIAGIVLGWVGVGVLTLCIVALVVGGLPK